MRNEQNNTLVAIYARVSTKEKQEIQNQLRELRQWCGRMGHRIYHEYIDKETGSKGRSERKQFSQMFKDASQRKFDLVVFWALDRFTREGLQKTIYYLQQLDGYGVKFHSYQEEYLNTDNELVRDILISVLASLAKQERRRISERTKAGLDTARQKGKKLGAPSKGHLKDEIVRLVRQGNPKQAVAKKLKISRSTVYKYSPATKD
jgi:DNA invertase Pin-like site-specific DNA recombinase